MLKKPTVDASEEQVEAYVRNWVLYAAQNGFGSAMKLLDPNPNVPWSDALFDELTINHFDDDQHCTITDPRDIPALRVEVYPYNDKSGFAVDHDLPLNEKRSDFTAQFDIRRNKSEMTVILEDIHIL